MCGSTNRTWMTRPRHPIRLTASSILKNEFPSPRFQERTDINTEAQWHEPCHPTLVAVVYPRKRTAHRSVDHQKYDRHNEDLIYRRKTARPRKQGTCHETYPENCRVHRRNGVRQREHSVG